jgi:hypothetical protein
MLHVPLMLDRYVRPIELDAHEVFEPAQSYPSDPNARRRLSGPHTHSEATETTSASQFEDSLSTADVAAA